MNKFNFFFFYLMQIIFNQNFQPEFQLEGHHDFDFLVYFGKEI